MTAEYRPLTKQRIEELEAPIKRQRHELTQQTPDAPVLPARGLQPDSPLPVAQTWEVPTVTRDVQGRIRWKLSGNTPEENEQLGIRNVQALFLEKFPEFKNIILISVKEGIDPSKKLKAEEFIIDQIGDTDKFIATCSNSALNRVAVPYFEGSYAKAVKKSFAPFGLDFRYEERLKKLFAVSQDTITMDFDRNSDQQDEWISQYALKKYLSAKGSHVVELLRKFTEVYPEMCRELFMRGRICRYYKSDLVEMTVAEIAKSKLMPIKKIDQEPTPEGWMISAKVARKLGVKSSTVKRLVGPYRENHGDWFRYSNERGQRRVHYSPDLVAIVTDEVEKRIAPRLVKVPIDWENVFSFASRIKVAPKRVKKIAEQFEADHPEWFLEAQSPSGRGRPGMQYSPELVNAIISIINEERSILPNNQEWMSLATIIRQVKEISGRKFHATIPLILQENKEDYPDWFRAFVDKNGDSITMYSPKLLPILLDRLNSRYAWNPTSEGWKSNSILHNELHTEYPTTKSVAEQFRQTHPEWFRVGPARGVSVEYYSPQLVEIIIQQLRSEKAIEKSPNGWETTSVLRHRLHMSSNTIKAIADRFRDDNPDWFKTYLAGPKSAEFYSPDLIAEITRIIDEENHTKNQKPTISPEEANEKFLRFLEEEEQNEPDSH